MTRRLRGVSRWCSSGPIAHTGPGLRRDEQTITRRHKRLQISPAFLPALCASTCGQWTPRGHPRSPQSLSQWAATPRSPVPRSPLSFSGQLRPLVSYTSTSNAHRYAALRTQRRPRLPRLALFQLASHWPAATQALCTSSHLSVHLDLSESDGPNGAAPLWAGVGSLAVESTSISRMFLQGSTAQALPGVECLLEKLAAGIVDEGGEPQGGGAASSSADRVVLQRGVGCGVLGGQGFAHASVQLAIEPTADEGLVDLTTAAVASASRSRSRSSVRVGSSPLHIILFVNNKRVDESGCLALNCACWDAVARAKAWRAAGVTVFAGDAAGAQLCIHAARHSFRSAWLVLHVRAGAIAFSDHGKTCLRPLKGLPAAINSALSLALSQVGKTLAPTRLALHVARRTVAVRILTLARHRSTAGMRRPCFSRRISRALRPERAQDTSVRFTPRDGAGVHPQRRRSPRCLVRCGSRGLCAERRRRRGGNSCRASGAHP